MEHARSIVEIASLSGPAAAVLVSIIMCIWLLTALQKPMRDLAGGTTTANAIGGGSRPLLHLHPVR